MWQCVYFSGNNQMVNKDYLAKREEVRTFCVINTFLVGDVFNFINVGVLFVCL